MHLTVNPAWIATAKNILIIGAAIFGVIEGMKNLPWWKDWFVAHGNVSVLINAILALTVSLGACLSGFIDADFVTCVLTAIGIFLTAAGIHGVKTALAVP